MSSRFYTCKYVFFIMLLSVLRVAEAVECSAIFTDGLQNTQNGGKINFGNSSKVQNSPDNILDTKHKITDNSNGNSCDVATCVQSGTAAEATDYNANFPGGSSFTPGAALTLTPGDYTSLTTNNALTLKLSAGDYTFRDNFSLGANSSIIIEGTGVVRLFLNQNINIGESTEINKGGSATNFLLYFNQGVSLPNSTNITAFIYGEKTISLNENAQVTGAISATQDITLKSNSTVIFYDTAPDLGDFCTGQTPLAPTTEYRFDESSYTGAPDEIIDSIVGANGQAVDSQPVAGKVCNAIDLNASGVDDYAILDESILDGKNNFSISLWSKSSKTSNQSFLSGAGASANDLLMWFINDINFRPYLKNSFAGDISTPSIADDNWHHLVWTREGNQSCLFFDKELRGCVTQSSSALSIQSLILGQEQDNIGGDFVSSQALEGLIDELLVFDEVISSDQVIAIYDNQEAGLGFDGSPRVCPPILIPISCDIDDLPDIVFSDNFTTQKPDWSPTNFIPRISNWPGDSIADYPNENQDIQLFFDNGEMQINGDSNKGDNEYGMAQYDLTVEDLDNSVAVNYAFSADITAIKGFNNNDVGLIFGFENQNNYYLARWTKYGSTYDGDSSFPGTYRSLDLVKMSGGFATLLDTFDNFNIDDPFNLKVVVNNQGTAVCANDTAVLFTATEQPILNNIGLFSYDNDQGVFIDNVEVRCDDCQLNEPILDYRFDECSYTGNDGDVLDNMGNYNGNSNGVPSPVDEAIINKSLDLSANGTTDWIGVPNDVIDGLDDFSVSVWFKTSINKSQQEILHALGNDSSDELEIFLRGNNTVYIKVLNNRHELDSGVVLTDDNWHHLVLTRVGENVCLFIDGTEQQCANGVSAGVLIVDNDNAVVIGQEQDDFGGNFTTEQNFVGQLDEFKVYDLQLSNTAIDTIYQNELAGNNYDGSSRDASDCCESLGLLSAVGIRIDNAGSNRQVNSTTEAEYIYDAWIAAGEPATGFIDGGTYNVAASGSSTVDRIDFGGDTQSFAGTLPYPGIGSVGDESFSDFLVHSSGTISLPAGDYTIYVESDDGFSFVMETLSGSLVEFTNTSRSSAGPDNELRFEGTTGNARARGSFNLAEDSVFDTTAIFFERGGGDFFEISIANGTLNNAPPSGYEILAHGALGGKVIFGDCEVPSSIDHYQIIHDGNALTCAAEEVTIKACTNVYDGTCTESAEAITLDVKATGTETATDSINFTGSGIANIAYSIAEPTILSIENVSVLPANPTVCFDGSTTSCNLNFADTGFRFFSNSEGTAIPEQLSGKASNVGFNQSVLKVQTIEKSPDTGACQAAFIDSNTIEMVATCVDPIACAGSQVVINNLSTDTPIDTLNNVATKTYTDVALDFSNDTVNTADFIFTYPDAGQVQLHAQYNIRDENGLPTGNYMRGSSNIFVVRPFGFFIDVTDNKKAQTANDANSVFKKAGEDFTTSLTAVQWQAADDSDENGVPDTNADLSNNNATINFGNEETPETAAITDSLFLPDPGTQGTLTNTTFSSFNSGIATNTMTYSEVGIVNFTANLTGNSYLGGSDVIGNEPYVGRFTPDHFILDQINGSLTVICDNTSPITEMAFAYNGQMSNATPSTGGAIRYDFNPMFTITAKSVGAANTTLNYTGDFMKLVENSIIRKTIFQDGNTFFAPVFDGSKEGSLGTKLALTSDLNAVTTQDLKNNEGLGVVTYTFKDADNFVYHHEKNGETEIFTTDINLPIVSIIDLDSVTAEDKDGDFDNALESVLTLEPTGVEIRFGRAQLENSYGPDTSDLPQPLSINYYTENGYVLSKNDTCTIYNSSNITLSNISLDPALTPIKNAVSGKFNTVEPDGETLDIILKAPTVDINTSNTGQVQVIYNIDDWLKYDWAYDDEEVDGLYNDNPRAEATFGIYRGNDRIIYQREISR